MVTSLLHHAVEGPVADDRMSSFPPACCCWQGTCREGLRRRGGRRGGHETRGLQGTQQLNGEAPEASTGVPSETGVQSNYAAALMLLSAAVAEQIAVVGSARVGTGHVSSA